MNKFHTTIKTTLPTHYFFKLLLRLTLLITLGVFIFNNTATGQCSLVRTTSNTTTCRTGIDLSFSFRQEQEKYTMSNGKFEEFTDGTAKLTGWSPLGEVTVNFYSRKSSGDPFFLDCSSRNTNDWYYYDSFSGYIGDRYIVHKSATQFQVGTGANTFDNVYGGAGWFKWGEYGGDINVRLSGNTTDINNLGAPTITCESNVNGVWQVEDDCTVYVCKGDQLQLSVTPNIASVNWTGPNGYAVYQTNSIALREVDYNTAGTYTAEVSENGCVGSKTITVIVEECGTTPTIPTTPSELVVECESNINGVWKTEDDCAVFACKGDQVYLSVLPNTAAVNWTGPNGYTAFQTGDLYLGQVDQNQAGSYTATVTENGSTVNKIITLIVGECGTTITVDPSPPVVAPNLTVGCESNINGIWQTEDDCTVYVCQGDQLQLSVTPNVWSVNWSGPNYFTADLTNDLNLGVVDYSMGGTYTATVSDKGLTVTKDIRVIVEDCYLYPEAKVAKIDATCDQDNGRIQFTYEENPQNPLMFFSIDDGQTYHPRTELGTSTFKNLPAGNYYLSIKWDDELGKVIDMGMVKISKLPSGFVPTITKSNDISCAKSYASLTASPGQSYIWSTGSRNRTITADFQGGYAVTVTDFDGCVGQEVIEVFYDNNRPTATVSSKNGTCVNGGEIEFQYEEPTINPAIQVSIDGGATYYLETEPGRSIFRALKAGTYHTKIKWSGQVSCEVDLGIIEIVDPVIDFTPTIIKSNDLDCYNGSATLTASEGAACTWSTGETTPSIIVNSTGTYSVAITNEEGCTHVAFVEVNEDLSNFAPTIIKSNDLDCNNSSVTLTASEGAACTWSTGETTPSITVNSVGTYSVTITSDAGCTHVATIDVNEDTTQPSITLKKSNNISCIQSSATLMANASDGEVIWSTGQTGNSIQVASAGIYTATITAANGCTASTSIQVDGGTNQPSIAIEKSNDLSCRELTATLVANISEGEVIWSTGQTGNTITVTESGVYTSSILYTDNCRVSSSITVTGGCVATASVGNEVFEDLNNNGIKDAGEPGIGGVAVTLLDNRRNQVATTTTNSQGLYLFDNLPSGSYQIQFGTPNGFTASPRTGFGDNDNDNNSDNNPANGNRTDLFFLSSGENNPTIDAGFFAGQICDNLTFGGKIGFGNVCAGTIVESCGNEDAGTIVESCNLPSGGSGDIEYIWLKNEASCTGPTGTVAQMLVNPDGYDWKLIADSNTPSLNPGIVTTSTCFLRCARRAGCDQYLGESNIVRIEINPNCGGNTETERTTESCGSGTSITYGNGMIKMDGGSFYQIFDANWQTVFNCGWDCGSSQTATDLSAGTYRVIIKNSNYQTVCEKIITLTEDSSTDNSPTDGMTTESCDGSSSITYGNGTIKMDGGSFYQILDASWNEVYSCGWQCGNSQTVNDLDAGEYRVYIKNNSYQVICEKIITLSNNSSTTDTSTTDDSSTDSSSTDSSTTDDSSTDTNTETGNFSITSCGDITINYANGSIEMVGQPGNAYYFKINDLNNGWAQIFGCGWDCGHSQTANNISNGKYLITILNADWSKHCDLEIEINDSNFSDGAGSRNAAHLSFAAYQDNREVELQWLTNSSYKVVNFELERSTDGENFSPIAQFVNKDWSSEMEQYQTIDKQPTTGENYYRVKEIYLDGSFAYTEVQKVGFDIDLEGISAFPNPAQNELLISLKPYAGQQGTIILHNQFGQKVKQIELGEIQEDLVQINTSELLNGIYYLNVQINKQKSFTKKVLVHHLY